jgi:hypothetical protein
MAPIDNEAVLISMPAAPAVPVLLNWAMSDVIQSPEAVFGVQLVAVYQAVSVPASVQAMVAACDVAALQHAANTVDAAALNKYLLFIRCTPRH